MTTGQILLVGGIGVVGLIAVFMIVDSNNRAITSSTQSSVNNNGTSNTPVWQQLAAGAIQGLTQGLGNLGSSSSSRSGAPTSKGDAGVTRVNAGSTLTTRTSGPAVGSPGATNSRSNTDDLGVL